MPSEADALVAAGGEADAAPRARARARPRRRRCRRWRASLAGRGEREAALELLADVAGSFAADGLAARLRLGERPGAGRARSPRSTTARSSDGLDALIDAIAASDDAERRDDLRRAVVGVLDELGVEHPVARESRRKLACALY